MEGNNCNYCPDLIYALTLDECFNDEFQARILNNVFFQLLNLVRSFKHNVIFKQNFKIRGQRWRADTY